MLQLVQVVMETVVYLFTLRFGVDYLARTQGRSEV